MNSAKVTLNGTSLGMVCGAPNFRVNTSRVKRVSLAFLTARNAGLSYLIYYVVCSLSKEPARDNPDYF
jgi:hypothetical protein